MEVARTGPVCSAATAVQDNLLEKEDLVLLENGCACCSLRRDVVKAFVEIERRARQRSKTVDSVLMETTGASPHKCCDLSVH